MWRCVNLVWTDVSEEHIASIFRVEKSGSEEPVWAGGCRLTLVIGPTWVGSFLRTEAQSSLRNGFNKNRKIYNVKFSNFITRSRYFRFFLFQINCDVSWPVTLSLVFSGSPQNIIVLLVHSRRSWRRIFVWAFPRTCFLQSEVQLYGIFMTDCVVHSLIMFKLLSQYKRVQSAVFISAAVILLSSPTSSKFRCCKSTWIVIRSCKP
jgi:hypothetical protein